MFNEISSINGVKLFILIKQDNHRKHKKNHQKTIKLFPPVFEKQEMSNLGQYMYMYVGPRENVLKPHSNATLDSDVN